jgi:hypothetical protein
VTAPGDLRLDELRVIDTLADLEANVGSAILELSDPTKVPPADLAKALPQHTGPPPFLRISQNWLRAADVRVRGRVRGVAVPDSAASGALLRATLEQG